MLHRALLQHLVVMQQQSGRPQRKVVEDGGLVCAIHGGCSSARTSSWVHRTDLG